MTSAYPAPGIRAVAARIRGWTVWSMPRGLRAYIMGVPVLAAVSLGVAAARTQWHASQAGIFLLLLVCAAAMLEATRDVKVPQGTVTRDLQRIWYLAIAVLLPPVYVMITPLPLVAMKQWRVGRSSTHRRVFSAAVIGLGYGAASAEFHFLTASLTGGSPGSGAHAVGRLAAVAAAAVTGSLINDWPIVLAVKLTNRQARVRAMMFSREAVTSDVSGTCLAALVAFALSFSLVALALALPVVLMQKRFLMHAQLTAEARMDAKTGLLNASAWQSEAATELSRAARSRSSPAVAIIDIDHFKAINDTYGHLAGDRVLRAIAERLKAQLREEDVIGRFGGEEFAVLLPHTGAAEARRVAERLRARIDDEPVAAGGDSRSDGVLVHVTISVGLAEPGHACNDLDELLATADAAMYGAKHAGRNRVRVLAPATGSGAVHGAMRGETASRVETEAVEVTPPRDTGQAVRAPQ